MGKKLSSQVLKERFESAFANEYSLIWFEGTLKGPAIVKHVCGHQYKISSLKNFFEGSNRCSKCKKPRTVNKKISFEDFIKDFNEKLVPEGYSYLSGFVNYSKKIKIRHDVCGHIYEVAPKLLLGNKARRCPKCANMSRKAAMVKKNYLELLTRNTDYRFLEEYKGNNKAYHKIIHEACGHIYSIRPNDFQQGSRCPLCMAGKRRSKTERSIGRFIEKFSSNIIRNSSQIIPPYELDIYIPEKNLAIEVHGMYWHSEVYKTKGYHYTKYKLCKDLGIRLIQIYESEWQDKSTRRKVKNKLKNLLGTRGNRVYARSCKVTHATYNDTKVFLDRYHLQGSLNGYSISLALRGSSKNQLLALVTFNKEKGKPYYTLSRYCIGKINVIGGFEKLLAYFQKHLNPDNLPIVSFLDLRWGWEENNIYLRAGFKAEALLDPEYSYTDGKHVWHKSNFRKGRIKRRFGEDFDPSLNERELCKKLNIVRIYDAGKIKYVK